VGQIVIIENQTDALPRSPSNCLSDTSTARAELPKIIIGIKLNDGDSELKPLPPDPSIIKFRRKLGTGENDAICAGYVPEAVHHRWPAGNPI
jgi:hypothetical protein